MTGPSEYLAAFHAEFDFVYRALRRYGVPPGDVDDLVQEVFEAMWRRRDSFDGARPLRPWLSGIAFRVARNHGRRRWREVPEDGLDPEDSAPHGEDLLAAARARALVLAGLALLPTRHRDALVMHEIDGLSAQEMADLLEVPLATVYTRVRRARTAFAGAVEDLRRSAEGRREAAVRGSGVPPRWPALAPAVLLEHERTPPRAPAESRRRAERKLRGLILLPPSSAARPAPRARAPGAAAVGVAAIGALVVVVGHPFAGPAGSAASRSAAELARGPAPGAFSVRRPGGPLLPLAMAPLPPPPRVRLASAVELGRGLSGYWHLDDGPGSLVAHDSSGRANHCLFHEMVSPAAWIDGVRGRALELGAKSWLECPQPASPAATPAEISVSAWVRRSRVKLPGAIATRQIGRQFKDQFFFGFSGDGLRVVSHAWSGLSVDPAPPPLGRWFHTAFTHARDGSTRLFVDGREVAHSAGEPADGSEVTAPITIGAGQFSKYPELVRQTFSGAIDEVAVYGRALSLEEVAALAAGTQPQLPPPSP